jgi:RNA polymerase sigma-70 factor (ECF subfamily)
MRGIGGCSRLSIMPALPLATELTDTALLERVGRGDPHAYELIYNRYRRPALGLAQRMCGRQCVAEEIVQEAFLAVWRCSGSYSESRGSARSWIFTIVRNRAIDERRRRGRGDETMLDGLEEKLAGSTLTDVEVERRERRHAVHGALRRLPRAQRDALVLSHFRDLTNHETAAVLGRSLGTVKGRIRLGHAKLRHDLIELAGAPL